MPFDKMVIDEQSIQDDAKKFYYFKKKTAHITCVVAVVALLVCILVIYSLSKSPSDILGNNDLIEDQFCQNFFCENQEKFFGINI